MFLYEQFNPSMELNNDVKEALSEYPYLAYSTVDRNDGLEIKFSIDVSSIKYITNILHNFKFVILNKKPIILKVTGKKRIDDFQEFKGKKLIGNIETVSFPLFNIKNVLFSCIHNK